MIDIDALEKLVKTVTEGAAAQKSADPVIRNMGRLEFDDACKQYMRATNPAAILALIAEVRALRAKLETPVFTAGPYGEGLLGLEGANPITAIQVLMHTPWPVTVFYGDKKIYTSMAAFLEAHPEKQP